MSQQTLWEAPCTTLEATQRLGRALGQAAALGSVLGLVGDLGAGKTTFVQAFAAGFGVDALGEVVSPTYTLANEYPAPRGLLLHMDFYRLQDAAAAQALGLHEQLYRRDAVVAVEWANLLRDLMPAHTLWVTLQVLASGERVCTMPATARPAGYL
jgi:tRNA threonylcarbamoyladenosine biosynthesis protein TsaE